jgi:hypothetical protein
MWSQLKYRIGFGDELSAARARMHADHEDPRKRFVFSILAISYPTDPAYRPEFARTAVRDWYGVGSPAAVVEAITGYVQGSSSTPAYDAFRAAFLARAALPGGLVTEAESWAWGRRAGERVQQSYRDFAAYAVGYVEGHLDYRRRCGDRDDRLEHHRQSLAATAAALGATLWARTPFDTPL